MTYEEMSRLKVGDIVQNLNGNAYVIIRVGKEIVASRTISVSNPPEWDLVLENRMNKEKLDDILLFLQDHECSCKENHEIPSSDWKKYQPLLVQILEEKIFSLLHP